MHILQITKLSEQSSLNCLVIPVLKGKLLSNLGQQLDHASHGYLSRVIQRNIKNQFASSVVIHEPAGLSIPLILAIDCQEHDKLSPSQFQKLMNTAGRLVNQHAYLKSIGYDIEGFPEVSITVPSLPWKARIALQQLRQHCYSFDQFKTKKEPVCALQTFAVYVSESSELIQSELSVGLAVAEGVDCTKNLANTPGNHATPTGIAAQAQQLFQEDPCFHIEILDREDALVSQMGAFLAVAKGSIEPLKYVIIQYTPHEAKDSQPIVLVGKGITFDAGGISLKPGHAMEEMKFDMAGAASVLGTLKAISKLKLPIPVIGLLPLAENLPSGSAFKPGDVVKTLSGQTVEIINTDAEGRLILADALTHSRQFNPAVVLDVATLTGAVTVALGGVATGVMTQDEPLRYALELAGENSGDRVWSLPLWEDYQELISSSIADMANLGRKGAGTITAACFLSRFTQGLRWAHLDIAGTAWLSGQSKATATGRPVPLLVQYLFNYCQQLDKVKPQ